MNWRDVSKSTEIVFILRALERFGQEATGDDDVKANRFFA